MEYAGYAESRGYDQVIFRRDVQWREFIAFWLARGRVLADVNVNIFSVNDTIHAIVRGGRAVDSGRLANPDVPLSRSSSADDKQAATRPRPVARHRLPTTTPIRSWR